MATDTNQLTQAEDTRLKSLNAAQLLCRGLISKNQGLFRSKKQRAHLMKLISAKPSDSVAVFSLDQDYYFGVNRTVHKTVHWIFHLDQLGVTKVEKVGSRGFSTYWERSSQAIPAPEKKKPAAKDKTKARAKGSAKARGQFVGKPGGDLPTVDIEVMAIRTVIGSTGVTNYGVVMRDSQRRALVWWTANPVFKVGDRGRISGGVRHHTVYRGIAQTHINRVVIHR